MRSRLPSNRWLSCPRPNPAATLRLWCFPFAGGGASIWHPWATPLAPEMEIVGVRLPGRENRLVEAPISDPLTLVRALAHEIAPHTSDDYALFGHSLGGLLAFALAREIAQRGLPPPQALIVSGVRAPHLPRTEPDLHTLPDTELIVQLDQRYGGIPPALRDDRELLELFLPALRADLHVYEDFPSIAPTPALDLPILALGGDDDPVVAREQVLAWREHTSATFVAKFFPGGHFFLQSEVATISAALRAFLATLPRAAAA